MRYSVIVPVYNRPDELDELLESLTHQTSKDFEVIIVEDGSKVKCDHICHKYEDKLTIHYFYKDNSGPGQSRNYGAERASGDFLIILDSDVVLPEGYFSALDKNLYPEENPTTNTQHPTPDTLDAFGGPDSAHSSFTPVQKAISYSMTSFFTTGGIRGNSKKKMDKFYPRSFNMGIKREVYKALGGFSKMRFGEDIDFSIRIYKAGHKCRLIPEAWVWHKRRTDFRKFWKQVYNSGIARINLYKKYPESLKIVHLLPAVFTVGVSTFFVLGFLLPVLWCFILCYALLIAIDSTFANKSLWVGLLSVPAAFIQLFGYGCGFLSAWYKRCVKGHKEFSAYEKNFYD